MPGHRPSPYALLFLLLAAPCNAGDYERQPAHRTNGTRAGIEYTQQQKYGYNGFFFVVPNPVDHFHVYFPLLPNGTCGGRIQTDVQAAAHNCTLGMNGSPFEFTNPTCIGDIVSDGKIYLAQGSINPGATDFGLTQSGDFIIGNLNSSDVRDLQFAQLLSAFGWLVRLGKPVYDNSTFKAPRTVIGTDVEGRLLMLQVDGIEDKGIGITLDQAADWSVSVGGWNVVNLDGGGSSATFFNGTVVDHPTCNDTPVACVRPVTAIPCVKEYA